MTTPLRILLVEDSPDDAELIALRLTKEGFLYNLERVETEAAYVAALARHPDLILADWTLPGFSGLKALLLLSCAGEDIPFILVTGSIGEEATADSVLRGAYDCVLKSHLARLGSSIRNALENKRLRAEQSAQAAKLRLLRSAVQQSPVSVVITDSKGDIEYINPKFTEITGYSLEEVTGKNPRILKSGEMPNEQYREMWTKLTSGEEWQGEFHNRKKDGTLFWERATISPVRDASGEITHFLAVKEDITTKRRLEDQLRQAQKLESVGRLAGGVAHDFNNLLTVINGYCELILQDLPAGHASRQDLAEVLNAGQRAATLTRQLLAFSRKQLLEARPTNLNDQLTATVSLLKRMIGEDVVLNTELDPGLAMIMADRGHLDQVFMNLAINARDAMPDGGTLSLRTANVTVSQHESEGHVDATAGKYVLLEVSDTGVGMDAEVSRHAFEPFFTTKAEGVGTGLGLSTVYGIVRQNGGWIEVDSAPGQGATFRVYFPRFSEAQAEAAEEPAERSKADFGSETILVAEDQEEVLKVTLQMLNGLGYVVLPASGPKEALALAGSYDGAIDLLLTDVIMPGMNGRDLAREIRAKRPKAKILFMSGYPDKVITQDGLLSPGVNFITKPFSALALGQKIRSILGERKTGGRILVVDDEEGIRNLFYATLARAGFEVHLASDGDEALKAATDREFDLVITDLVMPRREGIETIQALRRYDRDLNIIAMSGAFGGQFLKTAKLLGAKLTLLKPVSPDELLLAVRSAIR